MSDTHSLLIPPSSLGTVALAFGAVFASGQPVEANLPSPYSFERMPSSYSSVTERALASVTTPHTEFVQQISSIYSSLSARQQPLGAEFEAAIFNDLESLYEE